MKQFLLGFVMLIMLTPSLVCAMTYCPMQTDASVQMPCHEASDNGAATLMLGADCMGVDLMLQDTPDYTPIAQLGDAQDHHPVDFITRDDGAPHNLNIIRGPPINVVPPRHLQYQAALILTTQRFRI